MERIAGGFRTGAPFAHSSAHCKPENVFLGACHGCVYNAQFKELLGGFRGGAPFAHLSSFAHTQTKVPQRAYHGLQFIGSAIFVGGGQPPT